VDEKQLTSRKRVFKAVDTRSTDVLACRVKPYDKKPSDYEVRACKKTKGVCRLLGENNHVNVLAVFEIYVIPFQDPPKNSLQAGTYTLTEFTDAGYLFDKICEYKGPAMR